MVARRDLVIGAGGDPVAATGSVDCFPGA